MFFTIHDCRHDVEQTSTILPIRITMLSEIALHEDVCYMLLSVLKALVIYPLYRYPEGSQREGDLRWSAYH